MSSAAITNTLLAILPTYTTSTLPKPLHDTTIALLAQSRSRAATLKSEEEPGRAWACAEIAIQRLQTRLNLDIPTVASNPPCPPRVYKKLYQYLNRTLVSPSTTSAPSDRSHIESNGPSAPYKRRTEATPTKDPRTPQHRITPAQTGSGSKPGTVKRKLGLDAAAAQAAAGRDLPEWLAPTIKHLCKKSNAVAAVNHVYVGVVSIVRVDTEEKTHQGNDSPLRASTAKRARISGRSGAGTGSPMVGSASPTDTDILSTLTAVLFLVLSKMRLSSSHDASDLANVDSDAFNRNIRIATQELVALGRVGTSAVGAVGVGVKRYLEEQGRKREWMQMEWWEDVPDGAFRGEEHFDDDGEDDVMGIDDELGGDEDGRIAEGRAKAGLVSEVGFGLGATDWLSAVRRREYKKWEADVMRRIEIMEREGVDEVTAMDADVEAEA